MTYEFEGKTEEEAVEKAVYELGLSEDQFDVEVLEAQKKTLFKTGYVRISVKTLDNKDNVNTTPDANLDSKLDNSEVKGYHEELNKNSGRENEGEKEEERKEGTATFHSKSGKSYDKNGNSYSKNGNSYSKNGKSYDKTSTSYNKRGALFPNNASSKEGEGKEHFNNPPMDATKLGEEVEKKLLDFVKTVMKQMEYTVEVSVAFRSNNKLGIKIDSEDAALIIGKKGANIDALQVLVNAYATKLGYYGLSVIIDADNYRTKKEEALVKLAYSMADRVRDTGRPILLDPMNSYERRIVHTTLNDVPNIETLSEGDGLYKRVKIFCKTNGMPR